MSKNFQAMLCERIIEGNESITDKGNRPEESIRRTYWGQQVDNIDYYINRVPKDTIGRRYF